MVAPGGGMDQIEIGDGMYDITLHNIFIVSNGENEFV